MSTWKWICDEFIEQKKNDAEEFTYEDFANVFLELDRCKVDIYYSKTLASLISSKSDLAQHCRKEQKEFSKRNNIRSKFGKEYAKYWQDREKTAHNDKLGKRARALVEDIQERVIQRVKASFDEAETEDETDEVQTEMADDTPEVQTNAPQNDIYVNQDKKDTPKANVVQVLKIQKIVRDITDIPSCCLSGLNILDLTNKYAIRLLENRLNDDDLGDVRQKTEITSWTAGIHEALFLSAIKDCPPSYRSLRVVSRTSSIPLDQFDACIHYDILAMESILTNFLNILEFGGPLITKEYYERTCAVSVVVPVLRGLFMRHTELSLKWFEIQSNYTNNHLFDGIMFYKNFKEPIALAEFGGSLCDDKKTENDTVKVYRNAYRVINELAAKTKKGQIPTVFIVLFHQSKLRFESLKLINDNIYVRTSHAKIVTPTSPEEISAIFTEIPKIFGWRDAMIGNEANLYDGDSNASTPNCTFDTSSVFSTP